MRTGTEGTVLRCAGLLTAVLLVSACGAGTPASNDPDSRPESAAPTTANTLPSSAAAVPSEPPGSRTHTVAQRPAAPPRPGSPPAALTLTLTQPLPPLQGGQITAIYQDGCGDPSRALVNVEVADPATVATVWYEYHVGTTVTFDGTNRSLSATGDFRAWRGLIGPFEANPSNANGGPIILTAHGVYRDGSERTVTATLSLQPCHR